VYKIKLRNLSSVRGGSIWESLAQRRRAARFCALYKACNGERAWNDIGDKLWAPYYLSRANHFWKIRATIIRRDIRKFSFVNRTIAELNQLPQGAIGTSPIKTHTFRERVRKVKIREVK
jgi:hypothetical protein